MQHNQVRFSNTNDKEIAATIRQRVNDYFDSRNISTKSNLQMKVKSVVMILLYFTPYFLMLTGIVTNPWLCALMWILMGFGMAGIGFSIMHDANHNSYSNKSGINKFLSLSMLTLGGSAVNWKIQHNTLHHGFTNIDGIDEDINSGILLRLSPNQKHYNFHRYQHYYAWFLYSLMTLYWFLGKDIPQLKRYRKMGLLSQQKTKYNRLMFNLVISKVMYGIIFLGLPLLLIDIPWWQTLIMFTTMHLLAGLLLGLVFQPAHVVSETEFPIPNEKGKIENNWVIHQLSTTANYAPKGPVFSWLIGGLNFQIEHHLFANVCHVHYRKISHIVRETALEYGLPYHVNRTFFSAIADHARMLKNLGKYQEVLT